MKSVRRFLALQEFNPLVRNLMFTLSSLVSKHPSRKLTPMPGLLVPTLRFCSVAAGLFVGTAGGPSHELHPGIEPLQQTRISSWAVLTTF